MRVSVGVVGERIAYLDCHDELLAYYHGQSCQPLYFDEAKGLYKLAKHLS